MKRVNFKDLPPDPEGDARRFAEIVQSRCFPGLNTDTERFRGVAAGNPYEGMHPVCVPYYRDKALAAGVNPEGKKYVSSLAREPGDPEAWVDSSSDYKRILETRGWGGEGIVNVQARESEQPDDEGPYRVNERHVTEKFNEMVSETPDIAPTPREQADLKDKIRTRLSGNQD